MSMVHKRIQEWFVFSAAVLLFVTAACVLLGATSNVSLLDRADPILPLPSRLLFGLVGGLELALSAYLLLGRDMLKKLLLVAWLAACALVYHFGLASSGEANLLVCLGNLTDRIPVRPNTLNWIVPGTLGWLLLGSGVLLVVDWVARRKHVPSEDAESARQPGHAEAIPAR